MTLAALLGLFVMQVVLAVSPGPATMVSIRVAATEGLRAGVWLSLGFGVAMVIWASAAMMGLALLFEIAPWLQTGLRVVGGLFLIWLGFKAWRGAQSPMPQAKEVRARSAFAQFRLGVLTDLANPKALAYFAAVFSGILPTSPTLLDALAILCIIFVVEFSWYAVVAGVFSRRGPRAVYARLKAWIERCFGAILAVFGARIAVG
ncbi:MAG: LysE family transporter [Pseudomonadota bacterium]